MSTAKRWWWVAIALVLVALTLTLTRDRTPTTVPSRRETARPRGETLPPSEAPESAPEETVAPPERTVRDQAARDDLRRRIWAAWNARGPANAPPGADPLHAPLPERAEPLDADYLRQRIREDFIPMARVCYDSFLTRRPGVGGRVLLRFTIVGDEHLGGVVDEASADDALSDAGPEAPGAFDQEFTTCLRESLLSVAFRPPPRSGTVNVTYPLRLSPDAPDASR